MTYATKRLLAFAFTLLFFAGSALAQSGPPHSLSGSAEADTARQGAWQNFQQEHGGQWQVRWNNYGQAGRVPTSADVRKAPATVFGGLTKPYAGPPEQAARTFLAEHRALFGMPAGLSNLKIKEVHRQGPITHVRFQQTHQGIPIHEGGYAVHLREDGRIDMANGDYYAEIDVSSTAPSVSEQTARQTAIRSAKQEGSVEPGEPFGGEIESELVIYPQDDGTKFLLAWKVIVPTLRPMNTWRFFIDATTGAIVDRLNLTPTIEETAKGHPGLRVPPRELPFGAPAAAVTGEGTVYPKHQYNSSPTVRNLKHLYGNGYLRGPYAEVYNEDANEAYSSTNTFNYSTSSTHFEEVNAYYHVDRFYVDYLIGEFGFAYDIGSDRDMKVLVKYGSNYNNAAYDPNRDLILFGDGYALDDKVIYHEHMHAAVDQINGSHYFDPNPTEEGAISEGLADYFAGGFTGRSAIGDGLYPGLPIRDMANPVYGYDHYSELPRDADGDVSVDEHIGGEFFSVVLWDLRNHSGISASRADELIYGTIGRMDGEPTFAEFRDGMIAQDQSVYGGQYACLIKRVFADRGIGSDPFNVYISGPSYLNAGQQGTWSASPSCTPGSVSYQWSYSPEGTSNNYNLGSGSSVSHTFYENVSLSVEATSGGKTAYGWKYVHVQSDCQSPPCPILETQFAAVSEALPTEFALSGNAPNPFQAHTKIRYALPEAAHVELVVYDMMGREVSRLVDREMPPGYHHVAFDASRLSSGVYVYRLHAGDQFADSEQMVVVK